MRVALVTGATGLVGRALVAQLVEGGVRVLATARSHAAEDAVREAGATPLHTDLGNLGRWSAEAAEAEVVFHLALPRVEPPLRRWAAHRHARAAAAGARALAEVVGDRPVVMLSTALAYGDRSAPAVDGAAATGAPALAAAARGAEEALAGTDLRVVRVPWVVGTSGIVHDMVVALRAGHWRIVGEGLNRWSLIGADDAAAALRTAAGLPAGTWSAAAGSPTQDEVVGALCALPEFRRPDRLPPAMAALSMGGAISEALSASVWVEPGRLAEAGWAPRREWRDDLLSLARPRG